MSEQKTVGNICNKCRHLAYTECPPYACEKGLHKDYEPITECKQFNEAGHE